jgi:hypothetical protein
MILTVRRMSALANPAPAPAPALVTINIDGPMPHTRVVDLLRVEMPKRAQVLRPNRTENLTRPSNLKAALGQIVGQVNAV